MRKFLSAAAPLAIASIFMLTAFAGAAEVQGKIQSVDAAAGTVTLADGTKLTLPPGTQISRDNLRPGSMVKVSYEDKDGSKVVNKIQVIPGR